MVISEMRKRFPVQSVGDWIAENQTTEMFVSTISFGELAAGALKVRHINPEFHESLLQWIGEMKLTFLERTLPVMTDVAECWGELYSRLGRHDMDLLIAATALVHDLTLVTRNTRHFAPMGVRLFNPYSD